MSAYYNEIDKFAAAWLRELIKDGLIADGVVDERSIEDVVPNEIRDFTQCHWFAGIGGWSLALRSAGWPDDRPVWTGSCPCQPFSAAGKGDGVSDERHLWPAFFHLIGQSSPPTLFGEQVEAAIKHDWLDVVQSDMEGIGYAFGAASIPACGVGAAHLRQRLYFVADRVANTNGNDDTRPVRRGDGTPYSAEAGHRQGVTISGKPRGASVYVPSRLGDPVGERLEGQRRTSDGVNRQGRSAQEPDGPTPTTGFWGAVEWLRCRDGKTRPAQPGIFPLANGVPNRVGMLRGAGNAITPQVAEAFIKSYMERMINVD